jgi:signal transduction histidine kinase
VASQLLERRAALSGDEREQVREIGSIAQITQEMMREIVWMLNPTNDRVEDLVLKMKEVVPRLLPGVGLEFRVSGDRLPARMSIDFKRNVFLVFKEAVHNIMRHANATNVTIEVRNDNGSFRMQISDNGRGFDTARAKRGNGLANMQRRATQLAGSVRVDSGPAKGTTVTLETENHANT